VLNSQAERQAPAQTPRQVQKRVTAVVESLQAPGQPSQVDTGTYSSSPGAFRRSNICQKLHFAPEGLLQAAHKMLVILHALPVVDAARLAV